MVMGRTGSNARNLYLKQVIWCTLDKGMKKGVHSGGMRVNHKEKFEAGN